MGSRQTKRREAEAATFENELFFFILKIFSHFFFVYQEVKIVLFAICTQLTRAFFFYKHETK